MTHKDLLLKELDFRQIKYKKEYHRGEDPLEAGYWHVEIPFPNVSPGFCEPIHFEFNDQGKLYPPSN